MQVSILRGKAKRFQIMFTVDVPHESFIAPKVVHNKALGLDMGWRSNNYITPSQPLIFQQRHIDMGYVKSLSVVEIGVPEFMIKDQERMQKIDKQRTEIYLEASRELSLITNEKKKALLLQTQSEDEDESKEANFEIKEITRGVERKLKKIFYNKNTEALKKEEIHTILLSIWKINLKQNKFRRKINNKQKHFEYEIANVIAGQTDLVSVEDLQIAEMKKKKPENTETQQNIRKKVAKAPVAHARFITRLMHVCKRKQVAVVKVDPKNTSKQCSKCGNLNNVGGSKTYVCQKCGLKMDRDINAAINIRERGLLKFAEIETSVEDTANLMETLELSESSAE